MDGRAWNSGHILSVDGGQSERWYRSVDDATEDVQRTYIMRMPEQRPPTKEVKDPLRSLMKQMGLKMGPDIMEVTISDGDGAGAPPPGGVPWCHGLVADDAPGTLRRARLS